MNISYFFRRWLLRWSLLLASSLLLACGGGDGNGSVAGDRIEPLDTTLFKSLPDAPVAMESRLPAHAVVGEVLLEPFVQLKDRPLADQGGPLQIGVGRAITETATPGALARHLFWYTLEDGSMVAAMRFVAEGAAGLRLGLQARSLPHGTRLRLQGGEEGSDMELLSAESLAAGSGELVWSADVDGPVITLEVELPPGTDVRELRLAVPQLSHFTQTVAAALQPRHLAHLGAAGSCHLDAVCTMAESTSRAVTKLLFTRGGASYLCTGTLLNDHAGSLTPYLLTASHCIDTPESAGSVISYWFFRSASCGATEVDRAMTRITGGADLLQVHGKTDISLLQLKQNPPYGVVFAGSYFGSDNRLGQEVLGLHHPAGDLLKASYGHFDDYFDCGSDGWCRNRAEGESNMLGVLWERGTTETGSSGSALFGSGPAGMAYLIGTLHGGNSSCVNPHGWDFYGRYEQAFAAGLKKWLWP